MQADGLLLSGQSKRCGSIFGAQRQASSLLWAMRVGLEVAQTLDVSVTMQGVEVDLLADPDNPSHAGAGGKGARGAKRQRLEILTRVTGTFRPGVLTALVRIQSLPPGSLTL